MKDPFPVPLEIMELGSAPAPTPASSPHRPQIHAIPYTARPSPPPIPPPSPALPSLIRLLLICRLCPLLCLSFYLYPLTLTPLQVECLRATLLSGFEGVISLATVVIGVGALEPNAFMMFHAGLVGLMVGAISMALGELVSMCTQRYIKIAQINRKEALSAADRAAKMAGVPSPLWAIATSAASYCLGAAPPLHPLIQ